MAMGESPTRWMVDRHSPCWTMTTAIWNTILRAKVTSTHRKTTRQSLELRDKRTKIVKRKRSDQVTNCEDNNCNIYSLYRRLRQEPSVSSRRAHRRRIRMAVQRMNSMSTRMSKGTSTSKLIKMQIMINISKISSSEYYSLLSQLVFFTTIEI